MDKESMKYAEFLRIKSFELKSISDSGYGLSWFAQSFYRYWQENNRNSCIQLWGNMGPHYSSEITSQFSEVLITKDKEATYKSNIFILVLVGSANRIKKELNEIKNNISDAKTILPYKVILLRFDRDTKDENDPYSINPDLSFEGLEWEKSFNEICFRNRFNISVGAFDNIFKYVEYNKDIIKKDNDGLG